MCCTRSLYARLRMVIGLPLPLQDTWNDLQLFMLLNLVLLALGALMRNFVTAAFDHSSPGDGLPAAWLNVYQVGSTLLSCQVSMAICLT